MSKNIEMIPFTEIVERTLELGRIREDVSSKVRGIVNDVYCRDIPRKEDWNYLITNSYLALQAAYNTGSISATTGSTSVTFDASVSLDATMTGRKLKVDNSNYLYDFTYTSATSGTISPAYFGNANVSGGSYWLFRNTYPLASDFERFPKNGGLHQYTSGRRKIVPEKGYDQFTSEFNSTPVDTQEYCRVVGVDTAGNFQVELNPPNKSIGSMEYDYYKRLKPMKENTAGTVTINAGSTSVIGTGTKFTCMNTGDYLRVDALGKSSDSTWYRIATISSNSDMTIATAFADTAVSGASVTLSSIPEMPTMLHMGLIWGTLTSIGADQNDKMTVGYKQEYASVLTDAKRIYKTRLYRQDIDIIAEEYHYRR